MKRHCLIEMEDLREAELNPPGTGRGYMTLAYDESVQSGRVRSIWDGARLFV
jgi:hypothetical protein